MTYESCRSSRARRLAIETFESRRLLAAHPHAPAIADVQPSVIVTAQETIPRFGANPTVVAVNDGDWSRPSTWERGAVPTDGDIVAVPNGISVRYDAESSDEIKAIEIAGVLNFATDRDTSLWVSEITVLPSGSLTIGTTADPIRESVTSQVIFTDTPLDVGSPRAIGSDPEQFGNGLIILGKFESNGRDVTPFVRATTDIARGDTQLTLEEVPADWRVGDTLLLPGTNQEVIGKRFMRHSESEEVEIAAINGNTITFSNPTSYFHLGIADNPFDVSVFSHVANTTRDIELRSENADGNRGHVIATANADVDIADTSFRGLGRTSADFQVDSLIRDDEGDVIHVGTNQVGRYAVHFHHLDQAPSVIGSVVTDAEKWGITVHHTDHATIRDNIVYDVDGSGIVTEAGTEVGNVFRRNLVAQIHGGHQTNDVRAGVTQALDAIDNVFVELGADGSGFWLRASAGTIEDNVVYDTAGYGYNFNGYYNGFRNPGFSIKQLDSFRGNEAVSGRGGLWITWSQGMGPLEDYQTQVFENFLAWNMREDAVEAYHDAEYVLRNITVVNDPAISNLNFGSDLHFQTRINQGINLGNPSYENFNIRLENINISGVNVALTAPVHAGEHGAKIDGARLQAYVNLAFETDASLADTTLDNIEFLPTFVTRISEAMPPTVANIWKEDQGVIQEGSQASGAPPIKGPGPQLPSDITLTDDGQLRVTGGTTNDDVVVSVSGSDIVVVSNGSPTVISSELVSSILFLGNDGDDRFVNHTSLPVIAIGGPGRDQIQGGSADDSIHGDDGDDQLRGGGGNDVIYGGAGADRLDGESGFDKLRGGQGNDSLVGGAGNDPVLVGGSGDDEITGGAGNDVLVGNAGSDTLVGGTGNDSLHGNAGQDDLRGGDGNDLLDGGSGPDRLDGGRGIDNVRFTPEDFVVGSSRTATTNFPAVDEREPDSGEGTSAAAVTDPRRGRTRTSSQGAAERFQDALSDDVDLPRSIDVGVSVGDEPLGRFEQLIHFLRRIRRNQ